MCVLSNATNLLEQRLLRDSWVGAEDKYQGDTYRPCISRKPEVAHSVVDLFVSCFFVSECHSISPSRTFSSVLTIIFLAMSKAAKTGGVGIFQSLS
jgi:hypothetical protein